MSADNSLKKYMYIFLKNYHMCWHVGGCCNGLLPYTYRSFALAKTDAHFPMSGWDDAYGGSRQSAIIWLSSLYSMHPFIAQWLAL